MSTSTWPQDPEWFASELRKHIDPYLSLDSAQVALLHRHFSLLGRWNAKLNLTSIRDPAEVVIRHYCESLFFAVHVPNAPSGSTLADIGSGAGFPGIPMAVARPDWRVTLIESHQRKGVFLRESVRGAPNIHVISERAEAVTQDFDWIVARAVDPVEVLALTPRMAEGVGLLIGSGDAAKIEGDAKFRIDASIPVPWGERRVCLYAHSVPRETIT